jgi:hypothetical protein
MSSSAGALFAGLPGSLTEAFELPKRGQEKHEEEGGKKRLRNSRFFFIFIGGVRFGYHAFQNNQQERGGLAP